MFAQASGFLLLSRKIHTARAGAAKGNNLNIYTDLYESIMQSVSTNSITYKITLEN